MKTRWLELLTEYDFKIKYIDGKWNIVNDALNRRIHAITIIICKSGLIFIILERGNLDYQYVESNVINNKEI